MWEGVREERRIGEYVSRETFAADCRRRRDIMLRVLGVRLLSRLLVLVCSLSLLSLLFLSRCGFNSLDADLVDASGELLLLFIFITLVMLLYFTIVRLESESEEIMIDLLTKMNHEKGKLA